MVMIVDHRGNRPSDLEFADVDPPVDERTTDVERDRVVLEPSGRAIRERRLEVRGDDLAGIDRCSHRPIVRR